MDAPEARYDRLTDRVFSLYFEVRQREALDMFARKNPELEVWSAEDAHSPACLLAPSVRRSTRFECSGRQAKRVPGGTSRS
jgi:hypothetical protein